MYGYQMPQQPIGRWLVANNYNEIQGAPVPMDGSQTMFMLQNEPIFYIVSIMNGQKMIQGYTFSALTPENMPKQPPSIEDRMARLEAMIASLAGGKQDESNIQQQTAESTVAVPTAPKH